MYKKLSVLLNNNLYVLRFLVVGSAGFIFNFTLLELLTGGGINRIVSEIIAIALSLQLTYILHDKWTYSDIKKHGKTYSLSFRKRYSSYLASNSTGSIITIVIFSILSGSLDKLLALAIAAAVSMVWNFSMNKLVIWRKSSSPLAVELKQSDTAEVDD